MTDPLLATPRFLRHWGYYLWHKLPVTRWLCPTCRKLDRLEADDGQPE